MNPYKYCISIELVYQNLETLMMISDIQQYASEFYFEFSEYIENTPSGYVIKFNMREIDILQLTLKYTQFNQYLERLAVSKCTSID